MSKERKTVYDFHSLEFLNATIDEIYHRKKHYVIGKDLLNFKCVLASYFVRIERVFRYVYCSDISLDVNELDTELFRKQFPFIYNNFSDKLYTMHTSLGEEVRVDGMTAFFWLLERFRNINLHSVISTPLSTTMKIDKSFIEVFPKISENIVYLKNGVLTVAGMLIMIFSVVDDANLDNLIRYFLGNWGKAIWEDSFFTESKEKNEFLTSLFNDAFQTNYEVEIRKSDLSGDILKDLFGRLYGKLEIERNESVVNFKLDISKRIKAPWFGVCGTLTKRDCGYSLVINEGSNFVKFFANDYELKINNENNFCELSNSLPPFMLVAFCYHNGIQEFDFLNDEANEKLNKLKYAKFYRDKDLTILCAESKYADLRAINKSVAENTIKLFLDFEEHMIFALDIGVYDTYSRLSFIIKKLGVPAELSKRLIAVRNFCAHYGLLCNVLSIDRREGILIDLRFIVGALVDLVQFLRNNDYANFAYILTIDMQKYIFNNIIGVKYKRIFINSINLFKEQDSDKLNELLDGISKSLNLVEKSVVSGDDEKMFTEYTDCDFRFSIPKHIFNLQGGNYKFRELNLIEVQGEGIMVNGCPVEKSEITFIETPATDLTAITFSNNMHRMHLDKTEKAGIFNKYYYTLTEDEQ